MGVMQARNQRSAQAQAYRAWYKTKAWRWARSLQLSKQPLCERHLARGETVAATTVNHRTPHRGNWQLFIDPDNLQSVCKPCHDGEIQSEERLGYAKTIGLDGWPTDPLHPANRDTRTVMHRNETNR